MNSADKLEEIRARADIVEIVGASVRLRRAGRNFVGLCPFHNEKSPSFSVRPDRGYFHCFGCGVSGSVFDFVMKTEGLTFPEALRSLANKYGIKLDERSSDGPSSEAREAMFQAAKVGADFFAHVLWNTSDGKAAREYLSGRGIDGETAHEFMLGYAPDRYTSLAKALQKRGLAEAGRKIGLVKTGPAGEQDMFRARLMFPIRDNQGRVIAFGGRVLDQRLPKYINSPESPLYSKARSLYGIYEARREIAAKDRAILVEGYIDVIALAQAGFRETVASLGTSLTIDQLKVLGRVTRNVLACFDGDAAGHRASLRALEVFLAAGLLGKGIFIPSGFDPDTLVRKRGADAFMELANSAELLVDYFLKTEVRDGEASLSARARAAERVAEVLRLISNPFEFDLVARKAADLLGIREELLRQQARRGGSGPRPREPQSSGPPKDDSVASEEEIGLLAIALEYGELREQVEAAIAFIENRPVAGLLEEICNSEKQRSDLESVVASQLMPNQLARLGEFIVGPLIDDLASARGLCQAYVETLQKRRRLTEVKALARAAASGQQDSGAAAQAVIAFRRETDVDR
jgi:DNA primase